MSWMKVDDKLHAHRKAYRAGIPAMGLWLMAGSWCADQLTDGFIPDYMALRLDLEAETHAAALVSAGLWEEAEVDGERGWCFHEWAQHQPTREEVEAKREAAKQRMRDLRSRAGAPKRSREHNANEQQNEQETSAHVRDSRPDPTRPIPVPTEQDISSSDTASPRPDVDALCAHLADRVQANGSKRPVITKAWRDAARLLLDRDGREVDHVHRLIDWCQDDEFWRSNVLSMPKFRQKYDQLRLRAVEEWRQRQASAGQGRATPTQRVEAIAQIGLRLQAEDDAREAAMREVDA